MLWPCLSQFLHGYNFCATVLPQNNACITALIVDKAQGSPQKKLLSPVFTRMYVSIYCLFFPISLNLTKKSYQKEYKLKNSCFLQAVYDQSKILPQKKGNFTRIISVHP